MTEQNEYVLRPTNGSSPVVVRGAARRDSLLSRGYVLLDDAAPAVDPNQKRRSAPTGKKTAKKK